MTLFLPSPRVRLLPLLLPLALGCAVEIPYVDPGDAEVQVVEAQLAREWAFFDFIAGEQLMDDTGAPILAEDPLEVEGWDLALSQFVLATPSGENLTAGSLSRGAQALVPGDEENPPSIGHPDAQVRCGDLDQWVDDERGDPDLAGPRPAVSHNLTLTSWFRYRLSSHQAIPNFGVFAVEDRDGGCVRMQVVDYYDETGESGFISFYWQYLPE